MNCALSWWEQQVYRPRCIALQFAKKRMIITDWTSPHVPARPFSVNSYIVRKAIKFMSLWSDLDGVRVRGTFCCIDELIGQALRNGFHVAESRFPSLREDLFSEFCHLWMCAQLTPTVRSAMDWLTRLKGETSTAWRRTVPWEPIRVESSRGPVLTMASTRTCVRIYQGRSRMIM